MLNFYTDKKAKEEIEQLNQRIELLEQENDKSLETIQTLQDQNAELIENQVAHEKAFEELSKECESLEQENDKLNNEIEAASAKLDSFDEEVAKAAQVKFESLGGEPAPAASADALTEQEIKAKFNSMPQSSERTEFYQKHKRVLSL